MSRSVRQLIDQLGDRILAAASPADLDRTVVGTVVGGPGEPLDERPGSLLLAVGARPASADTATLLRAAGGAGYAAVVVKQLGDPLEDAISVSSDAGVTLLVTPDEMSWRQLDALVSAASPQPRTAMDDYTSAGVGDLFALANAIAGAVGGAITVEDPHGRVLAYSNLPHQEIDEIRRSAILDRQTPDRPQNYYEYQSVFNHDGPVEFPSDHPSHASRIGVAVRAGRRPLGVLWAISDRPPLVPGARELLISAAAVAELHLLRMHNTRDPDRWRRTEALRDALNGSASADGAGSLGLAPGALIRLVAIAPVGGSAAASVPARILDLVGLFCDAWGIGALPVVVDGVVYALLPVSPERTSRRDLQRFANDVVTTARRSAQVEVNVAISSAHQVEGIAAPFAEARRDVLHVLRLIAAGEVQGPIAVTDDALELVHLMNLAAPPCSVQRPRLPAVHALLTAETGVPYVETVLGYLGSLGDIARTATELNVHENTVRYRIRRAEEQYGLDLSSPDTVLLAWLQLRLSRLPEPL